MLEERTYTWKYKHDNSFTTLLVRIMLKDVKFPQYEKFNLI